MEAAGLESGEDGLVCAAAATAKIENTKMARNILFMLDLTTLELIPPDLILLELILLELVLFEPRALPGTIAIWMQNRPGRVSSF